MSVVSQVGSIETLSVTRKQNSSLWMRSLLVRFSKRLQCPVECSKHSRRTKVASPLAMLWRAS